MRLSFVKMHGIGNDYVYLDAVSDPLVEALTQLQDWRAMVVRMSDRHKGIGADGVILVCAPRDALHHARMRMFNADGSESEMCGNGVRCVAKFAHDRLGVRAKPMGVETGAGVKWIEYELEKGKLAVATVGMGTPEFDLPKIPVDYRKLTKLPTNSHTEWGLEIEGHVWPMGFVSMGNPHAVCFVDSVDGVDLERIGPQVETHPAFPSRMNFHVVEVLPSGSLQRKPGEARMRTWERGSGITQACGTGACAVYAAGIRSERFRDAADGPVMLHLPGGSLCIGAAGDARVPRAISMTGPAEDICEGVWLGET